MIRYWVKSWVLVDDDIRKEVPSVGSLQHEANEEIANSSFGVLACKVLKVSSTTPKDVA